MQRRTRPSHDGRLHRRPHPLLWAGAIAAILVLVFYHLLQGQAGLTPAAVVRAIFAPDDGVATAVVRYARLPRLAVASLAGAGLAVAGALMQSVTRNPLASPATLGVNAGAYLALVVTSVVAPALLSQHGWWLASLGGLLAAAVAYVLGGGSGTSPARLALAGMAVALALSAVTGALQLAFENETAGLFLWGAGTLAQADWSGVGYLAPRIAIALLLGLALTRPLDLLLIDEDVARGLGGKVQRIRALAGAAGVVLAAAAVSIVGPIGFVGLMAPHFARLTGARAHRRLLPMSALLGAVLLVAADVLARALPGAPGTFPVGAATAFLGAPFLVWLARRSAAGGAAGMGQASARPNFGLALTLSALALAASLVAGLAFGALKIDPGQLLHALLGDADPLTMQVIWVLRLPRLVVAAFAGAALALSGLLLQAVLRNPLGAPEILGITSGAGASALIGLLLLPGLPPAAVPLFALVGGVVSFGLVYVAAWKGGIEPLRLALVGLAATAFFSAIIQALVVGAGLRVAGAVTWLAGSTYARTYLDALRLGPWVIVLAIIALALTPAMDLLGLGEEVPVALGMAKERMRALLLLLAVGLAAAAVATVGTLSFVGLMAPHMARTLAGPKHLRSVLLTLLLGATLVVLADTLGRFVLAPREIPSGLVAAALGAPYILFLLRRGPPPGRRRLG